jgi:hypothetical protein
MDFQLGLNIKNIIVMMALIEEDHLYSLPIPRRTYKWPRDLQSNNFRHHFYEHVVCILGWTGIQDINPLVLWEM